MIKGLSAIVLAFVILISFPICIALFAGGFGIMVGIFGALFGVIAGVFGALLGIVGAIIDALCGGIFDWNGPHISFPHFHSNGFGIAAIIITLAIIFRGRQTK